MHTIKRLFSIIFIPIIILSAIQKLFPNPVNAIFTFKQVMPRSQWMDYSPDQPERAVILDDHGGAFVVSQVLGPNWLLVQRIDRYGNVLWAQPGTAEKVAPSMSGDDAGYAPILECDQNGGVYIAYAYSNFNSEWIEGQFLWYYDYDVYVQHLTKECERPWGNDGVVVAAKDSITGEYPRGLTLAGDGGVFVLYGGESVMPGSPYATAYIQRLSPNGELLWPNYGKIVLAVDTLGVARILSDENGGAFLFGYTDYAQRINADGEFLWPQPFVSTGLPKFSKFWLYKNFEKINPSITVIGGWVAAAQMSSQNGYIIWRSGEDAWIPDNHRFSCITRNGKGGQYLFYKTFFQEIDAEGNFTFAAPKAALDSTQFTDTESFYPVCGEYAEGIGAFVLYADYRSSYDGKLVVQKIDNDGDLPWGPCGITVCDTNVFLSQEQSLIRIDAKHNEAFIFIVLQDGIFVTKIDLSTGHDITQVKSYSDNILVDFQLFTNPNPFRHSTRIWISGKTANSFASLKIYNITGKEVIDLSNNLRANGSIVRWDGRDMWNQEVAPGVYIVKFELDRQVQIKKIVKF